MLKTCILPSYSSFRCFFFVFVLFFYPKLDLHTHVFLSMTKKMLRLLLNLAPHAEVLLISIQKKYFFQKSKNIYLGTLLIWRYASNKYNISGALARTAGVGWGGGGNHFTSIKIKYL